MRIAELSRRTGVPVATIKYYLRERLLPAGELTSPNQAQYDESHVHRVRLVRALVDVGGLSIAATREVLEHMDSPGHTTIETIGKAQFALTPRSSPAEDEAWDGAVRQVGELIQRRGWRVRETNPARRSLAGVLATLRRLGQADALDLLDEYAAVAERLAAVEVSAILRRSEVDSMAEAAVILTALGDALLSALRRLAHEAVATGDINPA